MEPIHIIARVSLALVLPVSCLQATVNHGIFSHFKVPQVLLLSVEHCLLMRAREQQPSSRQG